MIQPFELVAEPTRRRILDLLRDGERPVGDLVETLGMSQPGVSKHLRVLRDSGFATVRPEGARRLYAVEATSLREVDDWLQHFRRFWDQRLDSLTTELARGKRERRLAGAATDSPTGEPTT